MTTAGRHRQEGDYRPLERGGRLLAAIGEREEGVRLRPTSDCAADLSAAPFIAAVEGLPPSGGELPTTAGGGDWWSRGGVVASSGSPLLAVFRPITVNIGLYVRQAVCKCRPIWMACSV